MESLIKILEDRYEKALELHRDAPSSYNNGLCDAYLWMIGVVKHAHIKKQIDTYKDEVKLLSKLIESLPTDSIIEIASLKWRKKEAMNKLKIALEEYDLKQSI